VSRPGRRRARLLLGCAVVLGASLASAQIVQLGYVKPMTLATFDNFGRSLSLSGGTLVVGSWGEDSAAAGVNGNQLDNSALQAGAAYVYVHVGEYWYFQAYLKASNTEAGDSFGESVSVSGDTIVVGAPGKDGGAGAVYVFVRSGPSWSQQALLAASNAGAGDAFGRSVSVSGDTVVVGAPGEASSASGVNGNEGDDSAPQAGAAYVFVRSGSTWSQQAYLKASNTAAAPSPDDQFGASVAVSGDTVIVGAPHEDSSATGVDGNGSADGAPDSGAAWVFVRSGSTWTQQAWLKASNTGAGDSFGCAVSASLEVAIVGATGEDGSGTGVNSGNEASNAVLNSGAAYVFERSGAAWSQAAYVKASNTGAGDAFGTAVSAEGALIAIGAPAEDSLSTGANGNQNNNFAFNSGAAYLFRRDEAAWTQLAYLKASNTVTLMSDDAFGSSVAVSYDTVAAGAPQEDSSATDVNGQQGDQSAFDSGAVFLIDLGLDPWLGITHGLAGIYGEPALEGFGTLEADSPASLVLTYANPSAACVLYVSLQSFPVLFKGGPLYAFPTLVSLPMFTPPAGALTLPFTWPSGVPAGTMLWFQFAISDLAAIKKVALSTGLKATTP